MILPREVERAQILMSLQIIIILAPSVIQPAINHQVSMGDLAADTLSLDILGYNASVYQGYLDVNQILVS
jgi:hypothetical protein